MGEAIQGLSCRNCGEDTLIGYLAVIRENADEGRVHIQTCLGCIKKLNNLRDGEK